MPHLNTPLRLFWRSLKDHPGLRFTAIVVGIAFVSLLNHDTPVLWWRVVLGTGVMLLMCGVPVLYTAWQLRGQYRIE